MSWYKYTTPTSEYFSPFSASKTSVKSYPSPISMETDLNDKDGNYNIITSDIAVLYDSEVPANAPQELPIQVYSYGMAGGGLPERLIPITIREDDYINLLPALDKLNKDVEDFKNNKHIYEDTNSIYKLGFLLFGPPGTGKTSFLREFIRKQEAIVIFLDNIPSRHFLAKLEKTTKGILKIIVFEEVVSLIQYPDEIRNMLDFLDGSQTISNAIYFLSTNYPESIPENVIRNGRIDSFVHVGYPEEDARRTLIKLYLKRDATDSEISSTKNMPIVDIRQICFMHKKTGKEFSACVNIVEEKNKMLKKHFGKTAEIRL